MTDLNCQSHQNQEDAICEIESDQDTSRNSTAVNYQDKLLLIQNLAITKTVRIKKAASHKDLAINMKNALVSIETKMEKQEDAKLKQLPSLFQEDTITIPQSLHNSKQHTKDVMTQTLPTIPELDVVSDTQYGASFDYIKECDNTLSSAKGVKQDIVKHVKFDDQESIETRFNIYNVNGKQSTHTIKHKRTTSFISSEDMIHSTKHMEQSNKASYVKKAVGTNYT